MAFTLLKRAELSFVNIRIGEQRWVAARVTHRSSGSGHQAGRNDGDGDSLCHRVNLMVSVLDHDHQSKPSSSSRIGSCTSPCLRLGRRLVHNHGGNGRWAVDGDADTSNGIGNWSATER